MELVLNLFKIYIKVILLFFCFPYSVTSFSFAQENKWDILPRIVSLDLCSDQIVLILADQNQVAAISTAADDVYSFYREKAVFFPKTRGKIEEIIMLEPDVVMQTYSTTMNMGKMTKRIGASLIELNYSNEPEILYKNIKMAGKVLGQNDRASQFNKRYANRINKIKNQPRSKLKIAYVTPSGVTAGIGTSVNDIIKLSGFESYAATHNFKGWLNLPIENLIMDPPDIFITGYFEDKAVTQSNWSLARHNSLIKMMKNIPTVNIPSSYLSCNGLFIVDAAEHIRTSIFEKINLFNDIEVSK